MPTTDEEPKKASFLRELAVPIAILLVTALVSGLVVPMILGRIEDDRRRFELQSRLIEQLVGDDGAAQVALATFRSQIAGYYVSLIDVALERRLLQLHPGDDPAARRTELQQDFSRERELFSEASKTHAAGIAKYLVEHRGNSEWVRLHYGNAPVIDAYVGSVQAAHSVATIATDQFQAEARSIREAAETALRTCPDEKACRTIADDARAKVNQRLTKPDFSKWDEALRDLVGFVSRTEPRV
ncbi:MAG TPA: hypothetical protein VEU30_10205 [Thermoanaerobaculia bacterium]|nr:hypothetical protein [Thermoanaerobaculia bacterium]